MCSLFLEVFVNLGVVPDHLWVCFDRGELDWDDGQPHLLNERNRGMQTIGKYANTKEFVRTPFPIAILARFMGGFRRPK